MVWNNVEQSYETPGIVELTSGTTFYIIAVLNLIQIGLQQI